MHAFLQITNRPSLKLGSLLFAAFLAGACTTSPFPVGTPEDSTVSTQYLGEWMTTGSENADNLSRITVLAFDENQYVVQMQDNDEPDERMLARVITTELEDVLLASASALGTDEVDSGWLIFRVQLDRDRLLVSEMEEGHYKKLEDVRSTKEVRDYVVGHIHELDFFDDPAVFVRVTDE